MLSIFLLIPLSLMLFVVAIWAVRYAVKSNQFEDLDNASQRIILDDRQERRQAQEQADSTHQANNAATDNKVDQQKMSNLEVDTMSRPDIDDTPKI